MGERIRERGVQAYRRERGVSVDEREEEGEEEEEGEGQA